MAVDVGVVKGGHIYALPIDRLARGFHVYGSSFSRERFTISCSAYLLYVPNSIGAALPGLGDRLPILAGRGDEWWEWRPRDDEAEASMMADIRALVLDVGVPFLDELSTVEAVIERLRQSGEHETDPHVAEALAYSLVLVGEAEAAKEMLRLLRRLTLEDEERAAWWADLGDSGEEDGVIDIGRRGTSVEEALACSAEDACRLLNEWNEEQRSELRLPKHASQPPPQ